MTLKKLEDLANSKSYLELSEEAQDAIGLVLEYYDEQDLTEGDIDTELKGTAYCVEGDKTPEEIYKEVIYYDIR